MKSASQASRTLIARVSTASLAISRRRDGLRASLDHLLADLGLNTLLGVHFLQPPILGLKLLEPGHQRGIHAAKLGPPLVKRRAADAVLAAQIRDRRPGLGLLENAQNLVVAES